MNAEILQLMTVLTAYGIILDYYRRMRPQCCMQYTGYVISIDIISLSTCFVPRRRRRRRPAVCVH